MLCMLLKANISSGWFLPHTIRIIQLQFYKERTITKNVNCNGLPHLQFEPNLCGLKFPVSFGSPARSHMWSSHGVPARTYFRGGSYPNMHEFIDIGVSVIVHACSNTDRFSCLINWFAVNDTHWTVTIDRMVRTD